MRTFPCIITREGGYSLVISEDGLAAGRAALEGRELLARHRRVAGDDRKRREDALDLGGGGCLVQTLGHSWWHSLYALDLGGGGCLVQTLGHSVWHSLYALDLGGGGCLVQTIGHSKSVLASASNG